MAGGAVATLACAGAFPAALAPAASRTRARLSAIFSSRSAALAALRRAFSSAAAASAAAFAAAAASLAAASAASAAIALRSTRRCRLTSKRAALASRARSSSLIEPISDEGCVGATVMGGAGAFGLSGFASTGARARRLSSIARARSLALACVAFAATTDAKRNALSRAATAAGASYAARRRTLATALAATALLSC